jgi:hypothetical protein
VRAVRDAERVHDLVWFLPRRAIRRFEQPKILRREELAMAWRRCGGLLRTRDARSQQEQRERQWQA